MNTPINTPMNIQSTHNSLPTTGIYRINEGNEGTDENMNY